MSDISRMRQGAPLGRFLWIFGMRSDITDVITHAKFYVNLFWSLGVLIPQNLHYSMGLAGRSYNSASTPCYSVLCHLQSFQITEVTFNATAIGLCKCMQGQWKSSEMCKLFQNSTLVDEYNSIISNLHVTLDGCN